MNDDTWIIVRNWDKYQSENTAEWIKLWTELNSAYAWLHLSHSARGVLATVWIEFSRSRGQLAYSSLRRLAASDADAANMRRILETLKTSGFLELSTDKPRAHARTRSREKKREEEVLRTSSSEERVRARASDERSAHAQDENNDNSVACPQCGLTHGVTGNRLTPRLLADHLKNVHGIEP